MLDRTLVWSFFKEIPEPFRRAMLREYLQYKTLQFIYNSIFGPGLIFIGGTALRIFYGGKRFSEDLDFDNRGVSEKDFEQLGKNVACEFKLEGINCNAAIKVKGVLTVKLRFTDVLQKWELTGHADEILMIKLDAYPQGYEYKPDVRILNRLDVITSVPIAPSGLLLAQKLFSIISRKRVMGRDIYDAACLFAIAKPDTGYLQAKTGFSEVGHLSEIITERLSTVDLDILARDVMPFLSKPNDIARLMAFPEILCNWNA